MSSPSILAASLVRTFRDFHLTPNIFFSFAVDRHLIIFHFHWFLQISDLQSDAIIIPDKENLKSKLEALISDGAPKLQVRYHHNVKLTH